ncbi:hypothetical protein J5U18_11670 [Sphingobacteriaceae bacterium WQ 2009]|uniref:DUF4328 domain-containing protein n=2 Tax=Rhinopithecimicrobium faecis TaxID=2820698 RepID=A0A8T4HCL5_9SPHI|nr:hypothetical protein [Sphingobacteriaceae bacterium WQ 2009]
MKPEMMNLFIAALVIRIIIWILFALNIRKTLLLIKPENRCLLPSQVWGVAIPLFNIYWNFEVAKKLTDSINNEFYDRKIAVEEDPTLKVGRLYAWLFLASNIPVNSSLIIWVGLLSFVFFINYWIKISAIKKLLVKHNELKDQEVFEHED